MSFLKSAIGIFSFLLFSSPFLHSQSGASLPLLYGKAGLTEEVNNGIEVNGNIYLYGSQFLSAEKIVSRPFCIRLNGENQIENQSLRFPQRLGKLHKIFQYDSEWRVLSTNKKSNILYLSTIAIDTEINFHGIVDSLVLPEGFAALSNWKLYDQFLYFTGLAEDHSIYFPVNVFIGRYSLLTGESLLKVFDIPYNQFSSNITFNNQGELLWLVDNFIIDNNTGTTDLLVLRNDLSVRKTQHLPGRFISKANILGLSGDTLSLSSRFFKQDLNGSSMGLKVSRLLLGPEIRELKSFYKGRTDKQLDTGSKSSFTDSSGHIILTGTVYPSVYGDPYTDSFDNTLYIACINKELELLADSNFGIKEHFLHLNGIMPTSRGHLLLYGTAYSYLSDTPNHEAFLIQMNTPCPAKLISGQNLPDDEAGKFRLSPNPGSEYLEISFPNAVRSSFTLYDIRGRLLLERAFSQQMHIATGHLPSGIYIYRLSDGQGRSHYGKWIKQ